MGVKLKKPAAFLDRDGVLNRDHGYVYRPEDLEILPGVLEGLKLLKERDYWLIVISNQSGVARALFGVEDVERFHAALNQEIIRALGFGLDAFYFCPHHPQGLIRELAIECNCRKPKSGLIEKASQDFSIDWSRSFLVGDKDSDLECAAAAGIPGIRVASGQYQSRLAAFASLTSLESIAPILDALASS